MDKLLIKIALGCSSVLSITAYILAFKYKAFMDKYPKSSQIEAPIMAFYIALSLIANLSMIGSIILIIKLPKFKSMILILAFQQMLCAFAVACFTSVALNQMNVQGPSNITQVLNIHIWTGICTAGSWMQTLIMGINVWIWIKNLEKGTDNPLQAHLQD